LYSLNRNSFVSSETQIWSQFVLFFKSIFL
jgi:hypothetical protein